ncbi:MAG TPA: M28 family peptidase [Candidatus Xenobia bacterium]|nr:M28 family peptidase [Candidatus Xenobia bacterium]
MRRFLFSLVLLALVLASCFATGKDSATRISGQKAMAHVRALVGLGERRPGSEGHRKAQAYILAELRKLDLEVEEVNFDAETPRGRLAMKNIIAKIPGRAPDILVVGGHYDTLWRDGFVGANDGGSSTALLLELARVLRSRMPLQKTVWVVFFDGEEAVEAWSERDGVYGSRWQAALWRQQGTLRRVRAVIIVDMIGDRELNLRREQNSTAWLTDLVWQAARDKGYAAYFLNEQTAVYDDHSAFLALGVPAVDLIDFDYGPNNRYWHTTEDTVDKVSGRSMVIVGEVVLETLNRLMRR